METLGDVEATDLAVSSHLLVWRPARIRSLGECLAMAWTNVAPMLPGVTPVVRMTLPLMMSLQLAAISSAVVSNPYGGMVGGSDVLFAEGQYSLDSLNSLDSLVWAAMVVLMLMSI